MKVIGIAVLGSLLAIIVMLNIVVACHPGPVRSFYAAAPVAPDQSARLAALERQVAEQQEFIEEHTAANEMPRGFRVVRPGDDYDTTVAESRSSSRLRGFGRMMALGPR